MNNYKIKHITRYTYSLPVIDCTNQLMLYPVIDEHLEVKKHVIKISHDPDVEIFTDYFGNTVGVFSVIKPHTELVIESTAEVITKRVSPAMDELPAAGQWRHLQDIKYDIAYIDFATQKPFSTLNNVKKSVQEIVDYSYTPLKNSLILSEFVYDNFVYQKGVTSIETPLEEVWSLKAGVCQDFAHTLIALLRMADIPARYVSGYICPKDTGVRGEGATHAWAEAYIPYYGWLGLDPTNNCIVTDGHVRIATGRSFNDCTPVKGTYKGSQEHTLEVTVQIENSKLPKTSMQATTTTTFPYSVKNTEVPVNSYLKFIEM